VKGEGRGKLRGGEGEWRGRRGGEGEGGKQGEGEATLTGCSNHLQTTVIYPGHQLCSYLFIFLSSIVTVRWRYIERGKGGGALQ